MKGMMIIPFDPCDPFVGGGGVRSGDFRGRSALFGGQVLPGAPGRVGGGRQLAGIISALLQGLAAWSGDAFGKGAGGLGNSVE